MEYNKDYKGQFSLGSNPEKSVFGLLKFFNGIAYIDLFGSFYTREEKVYEEKMIVGQLDNGETCIFYNCSFDLPSPFRISNLVNFEFFIHAPGHIESETNQGHLEFTAINFRLDFLTHWTGINVYQPYYQDDGKSGVTLNHPDLSDYVLYKDSDFELRITHGYSMPLANAYADMVLKQESWLYADINGELTFDGVFSFVEEVEELFTLMNGKETMVTSPLILYTEENHKFYCYKNRSVVRLEPITLSETKSFIYEPILSYKYLKNHLDPTSFFREWRLLKRKYEYPVLKVVETLRTKKGNLESVFLNLVFAVEKLIEIDKSAIHEDSEQEFSSKENNHLKRLVKNGVPRNTINFFKAKLRKKQPVKLKEKVNDYLNDFNNSVEFIIGSNRELFVNKMVDTRNHLAHLCNNCEHQMSLGEYPRFNRKLLMVLMVIIFSKLGLPSEEIAKKIKTSPSFQIRERRKKSGK